MMRILIAVLAFIAVIVPGLAFGIWTGRWEWSDEPQASAQKLKDVPMFFGDWDAEGSDSKLNARTIAQAGLAGHLVRNFKHRLNQSQVQVFLACGLAGPVCVHTPDVCYAGAGYQMIGSQTRKTVKIPAGGSADFFAATFGKTGPLQREGVRILWSWGSDGKWQAPDNPRLSFGGRLALYKLYVVCRLSPKNDSAKEAEAACEQFVTEFLPQLDKTLFAQGK